MHMKYENIVEGIFIDRPNRFIAHVLINGKVETCHVKNTGRCRELLIPNKTVVYLEDHKGNEKRKTRYSVIAVKKGNRLVNMDSQVPNGLVEEWLKEGNLFENITLLKREVTYGESRFDIYVEHIENEILKQAFIEVKGVTLEEDGEVRFPDAPTVRGVKHINELVKARRDGFDSYIFFVIQMKDVKVFKPNDIMHKEFGDALRNASRKGVHVLAYDCYVKPDYIHIEDAVKIML